MPKKFNSFFAYVFSLFPGAGHMYLGLMNRGLQIMLVFWGILMLTSFLYVLDFLNFVLIIVWFYSFFDSHHAIKKLLRNEEVKDELIVNVRFSLLNKKYLGVGCIVIGLIILFNQAFDVLRSYIHNFTSMRSVQNGLLSIVFIGAGIYILMKLKKSETTNDEKPSKE